MINESYKPRLSVEITQEQFNLLQEFLPWGLKRAVFEVILDDIISILSNPKTQTKFLTSVLTKKSMIPYLKEIENED